MLRKFSVRNFRCLRELDIEPFARVNLIVGENNVGKTALLEALFLNFGPGNPEDSFRIIHSRGASGKDTDLWEELDWLFHAKQTADAIEILAEDEEQAKSSLRISLVEPREPRKLTGDSVRIEMLDTQALAALAESSTLRLEYTNYSGKEFSAQAFLVLGGMSVSRVTIPRLGGVALVLKSPRFSQDHARCYSDLVAAGREEELIPPLQALDPRIRRLELLYPANQPMLYVDLGNSQLVPLLYMGEGIAYMLSWLLSIKTRRNGTVLIDEFENGLHYGVLMDAWKAVSTAARDSNVQVFATTHSWECVKAAQHAFAESDEDDFRLHRLERRDGEVVAVTYDQEQLESAIELNFEVR